VVHVAYLMPLLPLAGFVVLLSFAGGASATRWRAGSRPPPWAGAFVVACLVLGGLLNQPDDPTAWFLHNYFTWFQRQGA
jgi:hypothetical protein